MIADIISSVLGLLLIYVAILQDAFLHSSRGTLLEAVTGIAIVLLALAAGRGREVWYSRVLVPAGALLALFAVLANFVPLQMILEHWFVFWIGVFTGVTALWGALYPHNLEPQN